MNLCVIVLSQSRLLCRSVPPSLSVVFRNITQCSAAEMTGVLQLHLLLFLSVLYFKQDKINQQLCTSRFNGPIKTELHKLVQAVMMLINLL